MPYSFKPIYSQHQGRRIESRFEITGPNGYSDTILYKQDAIKEVKRLNKEWRKNNSEGGKAKFV